MYIKRLLSISMLFSICFSSEAVLPPWFAPLTSEEEVKQALESKVAPIDMYNPDGYTGLQRAVILGNLPRVQLFVDKGAKLDLPVQNKSKQEGDTALLLAIWGSNQNNTIAISLYLIGRGASVTKADADGIAPVHRILWVTDYNLRMELLERLIDKNADINAQTNQGNTMMHLAVEQADKKWIQMVKDKFGSMIDFGIKNNDGLTPLDLAYRLLQLGDDSVIVSLLSDYKKLGEGWGGYTKRNNLGQTGLMLAIFRDDPAFAQRMIERGAEVNAQDNRGYTSLFYAVESDEPVKYITMLLKDKGTDVNLADQKGQTALMLVPKIKDPKKQVKAARILIKKGSLVTAKDKSGKTVIDYAKEVSAGQLVKFLEKKVAAQKKKKKSKTKKRTE